MTNLVVEFSDLLQNYIDSPKILIDAVAIAMSSSCLGSLFNSTWTGVYGKPNVYILLSSIPNRTRRSSIQGAFECIFSKVYKHDFMEQERAKDENKNPDGNCKLDDAQLAELEWEVDKTVESLLIGEGSKEGIADALVDASDTNRKYKNTCTVFNTTEFGDTMKNIFNPNSYEKGVGTILSKMYYGEAHHVRLSRRSSEKKERYIPKGLYVTMCVGMQKLEHYLNQDAVAEGLQRRITSVSAKGERHLDPINEHRSNYYPELDALAEKVIERRKYLKQCLAENQEMSGWNNTDYIDVMLMTEVQNAINEVSKIDDENVDENPSNENIVNQSNWEKLYRISLCYEIANCTKLMENPHHPKHIMVTMPSLTLAKEFLDKAVKSTEGAYDCIGEKSFQPTNVQSAEMRMLDIIRRSMPEGITANKIHNKTGWANEDIMRVVSSLLIAKKIVTEEVKKTKPKQVFRLADPNVTVEESDD